MHPRHLSRHQNAFSYKEQTVEPRKNYRSTSHLYCRKVCCLL
jgi:hypothetical protein